MPEKSIKHLCVGMLAHVDAGKTTLSEGLLYTSGRIRKLGRVDHKDAYLDNNELERERGITIFSKQAILEYKSLHMTIMDTPGHVDFSAEMERTLQILDAAVLVVSGSDGVQGHTRTLWSLLERYQVPVFLFINKMDQPGNDREALMRELKKSLSSDCVDFSDLLLKENGHERLSEEIGEELAENIALSDEELMESYLETGVMEDEQVIRRIAERRLYPCIFGSALKLEGVEGLLEMLERFTKTNAAGKPFGAKVFKIARDEQGKRLTYMKITGGLLKAKTLLTGTHKADVMAEEETWEEKADQLRLYSGARYEPVPEVSAGMVCAVTGLNHTYPGQGLGAEEDSVLPMLEPVLNYAILLPSDCDPHQMLGKLKILEEEEPQLHIEWDPHLKEIHAMLMGEVQTEVIRRLVWDRFKVAINFGPGNIVYKETIAAPVVGIGHFEPLRHYAEVHLLLEPGERGSGIQVYTACSEDVLDRNWQRLIFTHVLEREHVGVLTGSVATDLVVTLLTGRAHVKHTEGGDFRQATYRAIRNGLKKAQGVLLEPCYEFRLEIPQEMIGRAMNDIQKMGGTLSGPEIEGSDAVLTGTAPVSAMQHYAKDVTAYTRGNGRLTTTLKGYVPVQEPEEIIRASGYDSELDMRNPTGSVFCAHGSGFIVPWYEVEDYCHMEAEGEWTAYPDAPSSGGFGNAPARTKSYRDGYEEDEELMAIFERTFGPIKKDRSAFASRRRVEAGGGTKEYHYKPKKMDGEEYLLVDGYNVIFSWEELKELAQVNIHSAQDKLMDLLADYQGYKGCTLILVFDAYKVVGHREEIKKYHNIYVVYTKEAETADMYIEKTVHRIGQKNRVTVATSDGLEQIIIMGQGAHRISARDLFAEMEYTKKEAGTVYAGTQMKQEKARTYLFEGASEEVLKQLEEIRLGRTKAF